MLFLACLILTLCCTPSHAEEKERIEIREHKVDGSTDETSCHAYLHLPSNAKKLPLILDLYGSGVIYSTRGIYDKDAKRVLAPGYGILLPSFNWFIEIRRAAILTIDKPGISYDPGEKGSAKVDRAIFEKHTQEDLLQCVVHALSWAAEQKEVSETPIVLTGHSEGALILARALYELAKKDSPVLGRTVLVLLKSIPIQSWKDEMNYLLRNDKSLLETYWKAIENRDEKLLKSKFEETLAYHLHALKQPSAAVSLESLAKRKPYLNIYMMEALEDKNTDPKAVQNFERTNRTRMKDGKTALKNLTVRYYLDDHALSQSNYIVDETFLILSFFDLPSLFRKGK